MLARALRIIFVATLAVLLFNYLKPKRYPPGILISKEPEQRAMNEAAGKHVFKKGEFTLKPLAIFEIQARVLGLKRYYSDPCAAIAPYDVAVGWGPMSDQSVLDRLDLSQGNRFFFYEWRGAPPIPKEQITCHCTNIHLVPADSSIQGKIKRTSRGDLIRLKGFLVEVNGPNLRAWRSSLSRTDSGKGACEILLVESVEPIAPL